MTSEAVTEAAAAAIDVDALIETYGGMKVPAVTMIMMTLVILLLVSLIVVGFIYVNRHYANFSNAIYAGVLAELLFGYLGYGVITFGMGNIAPIKAWTDAHPVFTDVIQVILAVVLECLAVWFGLKYLLKRDQKRGISTEIGSVITFGLAFYTTSILISQQMTFAFEYIMISMTMNRIGMETAVYQMLINGASEEEAAATVNGMINTSWLEFLWDGFSYVLKSLTETAAAVLIFGTERRALKKKWLIAAFAMIAAYYIPTLLNLLTDVPSWVLIVLTLLVTAAAVGTAVWVLVNEMPVDWDNLKRRPVRKQKSNKGDSDKKMPKIVMPD